MIKNERQYRITKAQAEKFDSAIRNLEAAPQDKRVHPKLQKAQLDALRSQLSDLHKDLEEYQALKSGNRRVIELDSFEDLPRVLIQARIASGMSQEVLAKRLGVKPQQIQRYEATDYISASLGRVEQVIRSLGIKVREDIFLPGSEFTLQNLLKRLTNAGLERNFVVRRLLPRPLGLLIRDQREENQEVALETVEGLDRIYGWTPAVLFGAAPLDLKSVASATARFKLPARVREATLGPYVVYAHYLALLVLQATPHVKAEALPTDPKTVRQEIIDQYNQLSFESALQYVWSKGIAVLPLNDAGAFHGACWRVNGRNIIVLKQRTHSAAKWLNDLLHEYCHAAHRQDLEQHPVIEKNEMSPARRTSPDEKAASRFAGDVILNGRAEDLAEQCVADAKGKVEWLKNAVPRVAEKAGVPVDALANYMAFRLSLQGINWWGTATNLQSDATSLLCTPRDMLLKQANISILNPIDRDLLLRALEPIVLGIAGKIGSGKSTLSEELAKGLGWSRASFGDFLRNVAKSRGLEDSREVLQELGDSFIERSPNEFCRAVLAHYKWNSGEPLIIDGIRHAEIVEELRQLVAPLELRLIYLDVDDKTRFQRLKQLDETMEQINLERVESHRTEEQVRDRLPALADLRLPGDQSISELVSKVINWVHQGDGFRGTCIV